ncbi:MAG: hypothetical protein M1133_12715 [Armatimonadetes bacterium]|nr:hypothetical protein [Armatimonadota bacterium]
MSNVNNTETTAERASTIALRHGIYADRFLKQDEKPIFDSIIAHLEREFELNRSSDFIQVELVAVFLMRLGRAYETGDWGAVEKLDRMVRCHLKDLKTAKKGEKCLSRKKPIRPND